MTEKVESSKKRKKKAKKKKRRFSIGGVSGDSLTPGSMFDKVFIQDTEDSIQLAEVVIKSGKIMVIPYTKNSRPVEDRRKHWIISIQSLLSRAGRAEKKGGW